MHLGAAIGDVAHPSWRASAVGVYRFWRDLGYAVGSVLGGLVVAFGLFPGLLLDLFPRTVEATLESAAAGQPVAIPNETILLALGLLAAFIVGRIVYAAVVESPGAEPAPGARSAS